MNSETKQVFDMATTAYLGNVGTHEDDLLARFGVDGKVLFVAFSDEFETRNSGNTVICALPMIIIEERFTKATKECSRKALFHIISVTSSEPPRTASEKTSRMKHYVASMTIFFCF